MDQRRFDEFARALGSATSRRGVLKLLAGTLAGGMATALHRGPAAAVRCDPGFGVCFNAADHFCCGDAQHGNQFCQGGLCVACPSGREGCGGGGTRANTTCCPEHATCTGGEKCACEDIGFLDCRDASGKVTDCCGDANHGNQFCNNGTCASCANGRETCGGGGKVANTVCCPDHATCAHDGMECVCNAGLLPCHGKAGKLTDCCGDANHGNQTCSNGTCTPCPSGTMACGGRGKVANTVCCGSHTTCADDGSACICAEAGFLPCRDSSGKVVACCGDAQHGNERCDGGVCLPCPSGKAACGGGGRAANTVCCPDHSTCASAGKACLCEGGFAPCHDSAGNLLQCCDSKTTLCKDGACAACTANQVPCLDHGKLVACCPQGATCANGQCVCPKSQTPCSSGGKVTDCCDPASQICHAGTCVPCGPNRVPCNHNTLCCAAGAACAHGTTCTCPKGFTACPATGKLGGCCDDQSETCCGGRCVPKGTPFCSSGDQKHQSCCLAGEQCCTSEHGVSCCGQDQKCKNGRCVIAKCDPPCGVGFNGKLTCCLHGACVPIDDQAGSGCACCDAGTCVASVDQCPGGVCKDGICGTPCGQSACPGPYPGLPDLFPRYCCGPGIYPEGFCCSGACCVTANNAHDGGRSGICIPSVPHDTGTCCDCSFCIGGLDLCIPPSTCLGNGQGCSS